MANTSCPFDQELALGDENSRVGILQSFMLNTLKIYNGPITNYFGPLTKAAVQKFQESSGLLQTGKVDLVTATSLCKIYLSYKTSEPLNIQSGECFLKTLGLQRGYFENENEEVKNLQKYLNQKGHYPENIISGYFGMKTETALKSFQKANNVSQSGIVDDVTFKLICGYENTQSNYCPFITNNLSIGYFEEKNNEVEALQMILSKLGILDEKNITGYFGRITEAAVKTMQTKSNLVPTGVLDLDTRQVLCKMISLPMKDEGANPYESVNSNIDVSIINVSVFPKGEINVNTKNSIVINVKNVGSEKTKEIKGSLYINDKEINKSNIVAMEPGQEAVAIVQNWTCEKEGIYALKVFIDSENQLVEKNKFNNVLVVPINCGNVDQQDHKYVCNKLTQKCEIDNTNGTMLLDECQKMCVPSNKLADLVIEKFTADKKELKQNETANISIVEKNIGQAYAGYHKANLIVNGTDNEAEWPALEAGEQNVFNNIPFKCIEPGVYTLRINTDSENTVKESNENNNSASLVIQCADKDGNVPDNTGNKGTWGDGNGGDTPGGDGSDSGDGSGGDTPGGDGSDSGDGSGKEGGKNPSGKEPSNTGSQRSGGIQLSYFNGYPVDCYNCPAKRCATTGRTCGGGFVTSTNEYGKSVIIDCPGDACTDSSFYRESPHSMTFSYNIYNWNNQINGKNKITQCEIDWGDGSQKHDCSFKNFYYSGPDDNFEGNDSFTAVRHAYINNGDTPIVVCPEMTIYDPNTGDKLVSRSTAGYCDAFCNEGDEDSTKCFVIYPKGWGLGTKEQTNGNSSYNAVSLIATPNPGKVRETTTFHYVTKGIRGDDEAWCQVIFGDGSYKIFTCHQSGSFTHVYKYPGKYTPTLKTSRSIADFSCSTTVPTVLWIESAKNGGDSEEKKYSCSVVDGVYNGQCVLDENGKYSNSNCNNECKPGSKAKDIKYVCNPTLVSSKMCMVLTEDEYTADNYKHLKRFDTLEECKNNCTSMVEFTPYLNPSDLTIPEKNTDAVDTKISGNWFTNLIDGIFGNKNTDVVQTKEKKYICDNGTCKETTSSNGVTLNECMKSCMVTTKIFNNFDFGSGIFKGTTTTTKWSLSTSGLSFDNLFLSATKRYKCDITLQRCVEDSKGEWTDKNRCDQNCNFGFITNDSVSFDALDFTAQNVVTTKTNKYKCNTSTGKCVEATSLDTNTYTNINECNKNCSQSSLNSINLNPNFNFEFNY